MDHPRMTLELRPLREGASTQIILKGQVATAPPALDVRQLLSTLAAWQGSPIHIVLSVAGTNAEICWAQIWDEVFEEVPVHHVEIRYEVRGIATAASIGHER
jgi:hypothetical protein